MLTITQEPALATAGAGDPGLLARHAQRGAEQLQEQDPELHGLLWREHERQRDTLMMVAASSSADPSVLACSGSSIGNVTTEGYPGNRYHAGCEIVDEVEELAVRRARDLFSARYANVQPHSGSTANQIVLCTLMRPGDTLLGMELSAGGHLTHGSSASVTGRYFRSFGYGTDRDGFIDYRAVERAAREHRPKVIVCGASSYPRTIDFARFRTIADSVGAFLLADISHIAGLVAAGEHPSPVDHAHITTTSTYKQLYGPRGGLILLGRDAGEPVPGQSRTLAQAMQHGTFPFLQGTPDLGAVAAKARAFAAAAEPRFRALAALVREDAQALADAFSALGHRLVTGGTDNHMVLLDVARLGLTGAAAEQALASCGIVVNRNVIPGDTHGPRVTSGIRFGTNTLALRGMGPRDTTVRRPGGPGAECPRPDQRAEHRTRRPDRREGPRRRVGPVPGLPAAAPRGSLTRSPCPPTAPGSSMDQSTPTAALSPDKRQLLAELLRQRGLRSGRTARTIAPRGDDRPAPLSFAQQRLWFLEQFAGPSALYNISARLRLTGRLDEESLIRALRTVVRRHEALRTTFVQRDGQPVQVIGEQAEIDLPLSDLSGLGPDQRRDALADLGEQIAQEPFDLARGPLLRARLVRLASQEHVLLLAIHHIISDGWSLALMVEEIAHCYPQDAPPLPEPEVQYPDFALWQRERLSGEPLERQLAYWSEQLAGAPAVVELPADRPDSGHRSVAGASLPWNLPEASATRLGEFARSEEATLFMVLLAGFAAVAHRWSQMSDLVIGSPIANRTQPQTERMLGFFVNLLPLRVDLSGDPTFRELVGRVRRTSLAAYEHQDIPFERMVEAVRPERAAGGQTPFANLLLVLQNMPDPALSLPGLRIEVDALDTGTAKFDLYLQAAETEQGLEGTADYSSELFDAATVGRFVEQWLRVLRAGAAEPDTPISALPLLDAGEREALLREGLPWGRPAADTAQAPEPGMEELFTAVRRRAELHPGAPAVRRPGGWLTYAELEGASNRLAHRLRDHGAGPGTPVVVLVEGLADQVVAMLAAFKAGALWVPARASQTEDLPAGTPVLVADRSADPDRWQSDGTAVLAVESPETVPGSPLPTVGTGSGAALLRVRPRPGAARSERTEVAGRRLLAGSASLAGRVGAGPEDVWALTRPLDHGASICELWAALASGGSVVGLSAESWPASAEREGVTVLGLGPTAFRQGLTARHPAGPLRWVLLSGEPVHPAQLERWFERSDASSAPRLLTLYGAECSGAHALAHEPGGEEAASAAPRTMPDLGTPLAGTGVRILDPAGGPTPPGVPGELCLLWQSEPGETDEPAVLRTGESARRAADGALRWAGPLEDTAGTGGRTADPLPAAALLARHPGVRCAAVVPTRTPGASDALAAYVVAGAGELPEDLRAQLRSSLPDPLTPRNFITLDALPLDGDGLLDEAALPDAATGAETPRRASADATEQVVSRIWGQVLGLDEVLPDDEFFELGGHSLIAVQVVDGIERELGRAVTLRMLFESSTLGDFAEAVRNAPLLVPAGPEAVGPARETLTSGMEPAFDDLSADELAALMDGVQ
ncbi:serine hydroxymethyltransferase [Peterkaempfera sp. SMS 1(5)a]|uniref:serine hydroxymethyltransferase n=1 Tax=Peterkaempfera podocarpi TaxID=3232308 RepID=UPI00366AD40A